MQSLGIQEFVNALRDNRPNPLVIIQNRLSNQDYLPRIIFGSLFNPQIFFKYVPDGIYDRPGEFLLGFECDGVSYHSSPTARDRARLRQQVLEKLGWKIHRIWSTEWFRNKPAKLAILNDLVSLYRSKTSD